MKYIKWFKEITRKDINIAGGKGANLGEMTKAKIPVPDGFVVTSEAYYHFIKKGSLKNKLVTELKDLDTHDSKKLIKASKNVKTAILGAKMPEEIKEEIISAYKKLSSERDKEVAVRSSATAEDLPEASFAGQQETYLNVKGEKEVVKSVQKCWASLFESRAIFYREDKGFDHLKVGIAVPVQLMVQSDVSGIMFTVNPVTNDKDQISVEAAFGLGQPVVSGELTPDQYLVDKKSFKIIEKNIISQDWQLTRKGNVKVSSKHKKAQKLEDKLIVELAKIGAQIEKHYDFPQDIEWGQEGGVIKIVQTRPITTIKEMKSSEEIQIDDERFILEGLGASVGSAFGKVKILKGPKEISKIKKGDILVAEMTNPDYVPAMRRAAAILTSKGGRTSHAAIVSRELGIPCVVGATEALDILKNGEKITVDGSTGRVYEGDLVDELTEEDSSKSEEWEKLKTATKLYVNLGEPDLVPKIKDKILDGVGLFRAEFLIAQIGTHPREFIRKGKSKDFIRRLSEGMLVFAEGFSPRPVIYRATDFRTNEYRNLKGGDKFEGKEFNPMIGFRGASRYIADDDVFKLELEALKRVRNKKGYKNIHLMIPFVRTVEELEQVKKIISANGLRRSGNFEVWMMVEIPSNVILIEEFIKVGIDGISIGSNDLTMLTLGIDRDNEKVAEVFSELNPAVLKSIETVIKKSSKHNVTSSICGQAPSVYPELTKMLVDWGITSISVSPDVIGKTRKLIYDAEKDLISRKRK